MLTTDSGYKCEVFRDQSDVDAIRELTGWVRNGGMNDLRELSVIAANLREAKKTALHFIVYAVIGGALGMLVLGAKQWLAGLYRGGGQ